MQVASDDVDEVITRFRQARQALLEARGPYLERLSEYIDAIQDLHAAWIKEDETPREPSAAGAGMEV